MKLTTRGRKSGAPRTVTIWFVVVAPDRIEVQHASRAAAQWYKNLLANPEVTLDFGDGAMAGRAEPITDANHIRQVLARVRAKHWFLGPIIQWMGRRAKPVAASIQVTG